MVGTFSKPNDEELVSVHIKSELENAKIILQRSDMDLPNKTCTITTDKNVSVEIQSNITQYANSKGFNVKFVTSE